MLKKCAPSSNSARGLGTGPQRVADGLGVPVRGGALCGFQLSLEALRVLANFALEPVGPVGDLPRGAGALVGRLAVGDGLRQLATKIPLGKLSGRRTI